MFKHTTPSKSSTKYNTRPKQSANKNRLEIDVDYASPESKFSP